MFMCFRGKAKQACKNTKLQTATINLPSQDLFAWLELYCEW